MSGSVFWREDTKMQSTVLLEFGSATMSAVATFSMKWWTEKRLEEFAFGLKAKRRS